MMPYAIATPTPYTWDAGLRWRSEFVALVEAAPPFSAVTLAFVRDKILRAVTDGAEDGLIQSYIDAATEMCEAYTDKSVRPQERRMILSGFPAGSGVIQLQRGPVHAVTSVAYYDAANLPALLGDEAAPGDPPPPFLYRFIPGARPTLQLPVGASWPSTSAREDAVTVTYTAGYEDPALIPMLIRTGIGIVVGELYKNPDLSNADGQVPNVLNLDFFWQRRW